MFPCRRYIKHHPSVLYFGNYDRYDAGRILRSGKTSRYHQAPRYHNGTR